MRDCTVKRLEDSSVVHLAVCLMAEFGLSPCTRKTRTKRLTATSVISHTLSVQISTFLLNYQLFPFPICLLFIFPDRIYICPYVRVCVLLLPCLQLSEPAFDWGQCPPSCPTLSASQVHDTKLGRNDVIPKQFSGDVEARIRGLDCRQCLLGELVTCEACLRT